MLYIIGTVILIVLNLLSFFVPFSYVTQQTMGGIAGVGSFSDSQTGYQTLVQMGGYFGLGANIIALIAYIIYLVLFLTKKINLIPTFIFYIVALINPLMSIIQVIQYLSSGNTLIGDSFAWYSESTTGGLTMFAFLYIIGSIIGIILISKGMNKAKDKMNNVISAEEVKEIKIKKPKKQKEIKEEDFNF